MSGKKQPHAKMPKVYGKILKKMSKSKEELEDDLVDKALVDEEMALSIFK